MFERLYHSGCVPVITLEQQHRMPACIASFPSAQYYGGRLLTPKRTCRAAPCGYSWPTTDPICFVNVNGRGENQDGTSHYSYDEAAAVVSTVSLILADSDDVVANDIVVLTPCKRQVQEVNVHLQRRGMRVREVCNVDKFQGFECDMVFLSTVRCNTTGKSGFVDDPRRLNVAMTRAKRALIVLEIDRRSWLQTASALGNLSSGISKPRGGSQDRRQKCQCRSARRVSAAQDRCSNLNITSTLCQDKTQELVPVCVCRGFSCGPRLVGKASS